MKMTADTPPKIELLCDECDQWFEVKTVTRKYLEDWPYVSDVCPHCGNSHDASFRWKGVKWNGVPI